MKFDVTTAQDYAASHRLEDWLRIYLTSAAPVSPALSNGLKLRRRWWAGPLEIALDTLRRCAGPEPGMEFVVDRTEWESQVACIQNDLDDRLRMPPLIVEYRSGVLSICEGSQRHEAIRRKGWDTCWAVIGYSTRRDYTLHRLLLERARNP